VDIIQVFENVTTTIFFSCEGTLEFPGGGMYLAFLYYNTDGFQRKMFEMESTKSGLAVFNYTMSEAFPRQYLNQSVFYCSSNNANITSEAPRLLLSVNFATDVVSYLISVDWGPQEVPTKVSPTEYVYSISVPDYSDVLLKIICWANGYPEPQTNITEVKGLTYGVQKKPLAYVYISLHNVSSSSSLHIRCDALYKYDGITKIEVAKYATFQVLLNTTSSTIASTTGNSSRNSAVTLYTLAVAVIALLLVTTYNSLL